MFHETDINPDHLEGLSHWLAHKGGYPVPVDREHPFCRVLDRASKQRQGFEETLYLMGVRSTNSSDVAQLYAAGSRVLVERAYQNIAGTIDPMVRNLIAKDFKPIELGQIDVANEPATADEFFSAQDIKHSSIQWSESVITGQVKTYGFHIPINDRLFKNGEFDLIGQMIAAAAGKLGQLPVRKLADIINANPAINSTTLISTDNAVTSALSAATLQSAMAILERAYHVPSAFIVCPPDMKSTVAGLLQAAPALNLKMVSNPWLDSTTHCYLMPAPDSKPVFAKLAFNHPLAPGIRQQRLPEDATFFGQVYCLDMDFDLVPISRAIVRIGA